jgi:AcrR family transcriptional regulator
MPRPKTDIQPRILIAARNRFLEDGVEGASLRRIARDAGTSIGMIYYYYPTKDDLFFAIIDEVYDKLLADISAALARDVPVEERLRRLYRRFGALSADEVTVVRMVARDMLLKSDRLPSLVQRFMKGHVPLVLGTVVEGMQTGALDPSRHPFVLFAATFALAVPPQFMRKVLGERLNVSGLPDGVELADQLVGALLRGVGGPAASAPPVDPTPVSNPRNPQ